jgi:N-acetyl-gamma-glutamylphosphate reductase
MYMYVAENLAPYRTGRSHQHLVEVEGCAEVHLLFVPMVAPLRRGMLVTGSADVTPWLQRNEAAPLPPLQLGDDPLWHEAAEAPDVLGVAERNLVRVHYHLDRTSRRVQFVSVIDNLLRGAASHAIYNLNLACGWPALSGLQDGMDHA